jgi:hypothetical protein
MQHPLKNIVSPMIGTNSNSNSNNNKSNVIILPLIFSRERPEAIAIYTRRRQRVKSIAIPPATVQWKGRYSYVTRTTPGGYSPNRNENVAVIKASTS